MKKSIKYVTTISGFLLFSSIFSLFTGIKTYAEIAAETANGFAQYCSQSSSICTKVDFDGNQAEVSCPSSGQTIERVLVHAGDGQTVYQLPQEGFEYSFSNNNTTVHVTVTTHPHQISWVGVVCSTTQTPTATPIPTPTTTPTCPVLELPETRVWKNDETDTVTLVSGGPVTYRWTGVFPTDGYREFASGSGTLQNGESFTIVYPNETEWGNPDQYGARESHVVIHMRGQCGYIGHNFDRWFHKVFPTPTATLTDIPEGTPTPTVTIEQTPSPTSTPEDTGTPTPTLTEVPEGTPTVTPTLTKTPDDNPTPTTTPNSTSEVTPTPETPGTPTATPEDLGTGGGGETNNENKTNESKLAGIDSNSNSQSASSNGQVLGSTTQMAATGVVEDILMSVIGLSGISLTTIGTLMYGKKQK